MMAWPGLHKCLLHQGENTQGGYRTAHCEEGYWWYPAVSPDVTLEHPMPTGLFETPTFLFLRVSSQFSFTKNKQAHLPSVVNFSGWRFHVYLIYFMGSLCTSHPVPQHSCPVPRVGGGAQTNTCPYFSHLCSCTSETLLFWPSFSVQRCLVALLEHLGWDTAATSLTSRWITLE